MSQCDIEEWINVAEFARRANCERKQVYRAIEKGLLTKSSEDLLPAGKVNGGWRKPNRRTIIKRAGATEKHGVATQTVTHGGTTAARCSADCGTIADRAFEQEFPHLARARAASPIGCAASIERLALATPFDEAELLEQLDALAFCDFDDQAQMAEWPRWPSRIAASVAAELGIPKLADALERALRNRIVERLERELCIDAEIYLAAPSEFYGREV